MKNKRELKKNIRLVCKKCVEKNKGTFSLETIKKHKCVKAGFPTDGVVEHMWVKITAVSGDTIYGVINNKPVQPGAPSFGQQVVLFAEDVEELM